MSGDLMKFGKLITTKGVLFLLIFSVLVFVGDKINFSRLIGAQNQFFTLFQFFGPIAGAFLGPVVGVLSVLIAEVSSYLIAGKTLVWNYSLMINILRLLPMLFAAWYFGTKKDKISFIVPIIAIALFIAHPVGRQVWFFSLFWTIPILMKLFSKNLEKAIVNIVLIAMAVIAYLTSPALRNLWVVVGFAAILVLFNKFSSISAKSLGATFTAHAVGGAIWNYIVPMTPAAWIALIPIVIFERLLFAGGITISFIGINTLLDRLDTKTKAEYVNVDKKHVLFKQSA